MLQTLIIIIFKTNKEQKKMIFLLGNRATDDFKNAADEAKERSGYGTSSSRPPSSPSSSYGSSGETTTDKIKDKASEYAQQAKSTVWNFYIKKKQKFLIIIFIR